MCDACPSVLVKGLVEAEVGFYFQCDSIITDNWFTPKVVHSDYHINDTWKWALKDVGVQVFI